MKMKRLIGLFCALSVINVPSAFAADSFSDGYGSVHLNSSHLALDGSGGMEGKAPGEVGADAKDFMLKSTSVFVCSYELVQSPTAIGMPKVAAEALFTEQLKATDGCGGMVSGVLRNYALCKTEVIATDIRAAQEMVDSLGIISASRDHVSCTPKEAPAAAAAAKPPVKCVVKKTATKAAGIGQLNLSGLSPECMACGDCKLDDIVTTGAAFANLLTQLSAAFFFATFVYGGAMYLLSFGDKGRVDKGKKAITGAAIGMLIVLMAWTVVNYISNSLKGIK